MSVPQLLSRWRADPSLAANVNAWRTIPARLAQYAPFPNDLHPDLGSALRRSGIQALYSHQAAAWQHVQASRHVVIVTGTASGKTLAYNLPVLDRLLRDAEARALYLFPTKALAQDQSGGLKQLLERLDPPASGAAGSLCVGVYDGDTPATARPSIRSQARLVISNPDMLHTGILPHHTAWAEFFRHLQFVVVDEMHTYRGVFGSHCANVLRRLKRVARFYGAYPQFILTSATIANPGELAGRLVEEPVALVDEDGSARGPKTFLIYNPPVVDRELGLRRSAMQESVQLAEDLLHYNIQTILFARTRRSVELILTYLRQRSLPARPASPFNLPDSPAAKTQVEQSIRGYRSGYLPRQRRAIEQGLRRGDVRAVVATTALELGIDIGGMGAAILVGYPGTTAATWQQAGRSGRGSEASLSVLVTTADPLDQFLAKHPDYFFDRSVEQALVNPDNLLILLNHLRCAAFELPFQDGEGFGSLPAGRVAEFLEFLSEQGVLHRAGSKYFWMADQYPAQAVSLRSASPENVTLQAWEAEPGETGLPPTVIGLVDRLSAFWMVHPQAVYLHEGRTFIVEALDLEQNIARLRQTEIDYYTEPRSETTVQLVELLEQVDIKGGSKAHGEISVTMQVVGFRKVKWYTHEQLGLGEVQLPPSELQTTGFWLALNSVTVEQLQDLGLWNNAPNDYGPNWKVQRERARARDGYCCQVCGLPENGRSHDVHHKTPFRTFAAPEQANQLSNLITLCPVCHRRAETAVRVRSGLAGLGFVFGNLAPFFLMCDPRDLGVHSDPQLALAQAQPGVVLFDKVPAGIGFSQRLYELHGELAGRAYELVSACECTDGCPSCVGPGGENGLGGKRETLAILEALKE